VGEAAAGDVVIALRAGRLWNDHFRAAESGPIATQGGELMRGLGHARSRCDRLRDPAVVECA